MMTGSIFSSMGGLGVSKTQQEEVATGVQGQDEEVGEGFSFGQVLGATTADVDGSTAAGVPGSSPLNTTEASGASVDMQQVEIQQAIATNAMQTVATNAKQAQQPLAFQAALVAAAQNGAIPQVGDSKPGNVLLPGAEVLVSQGQNVETTLKGGQTDLPLESIRAAASGQGAVLLESAISMVAVQHTEAEASTIPVVQATGQTSLAGSMNKAAQAALNKPLSTIQLIAETTTGVALPQEMELVADVVKDKQPARSVIPQALQAQLEPMANDDVMRAVRQVEIKLDLDVDPLTQQPVKVATVAASKLVKPLPELAGLGTLKTAVVDASQLAATSATTTPSLEAPDLELGAGNPGHGRPKPGQQQIVSTPPIESPVEEPVHAEHKTTQAKAELAANAVFEPAVAPSTLEALPVRAPSLASPMVLGMPSMTTMVTDSAQSVLALEPRVQRSVRAQVLNESIIALRLGRGEANIEIDPPELGRVRIRLVLEDRSVRGFVEVENSAVRSALMADIGGLASALSAMGLDSTQFEINLLEDHRSRDPRERQERERSQENLEQTPNNVKTSAPEAPKRRSKPGPGVDYLL